MITDKIQIRPQYGADRMGYVYHANDVNYYQQARAELLRKYGINDCLLKKKNIMQSVIRMNLKYFKPAYYDDLLTVTTSIQEMPHIRRKFEFEITSKKEEKAYTANSALVLVPVMVPERIQNVLKNNFKSVNS